MGVSTIALADRRARIVQTQGWRSEIARKGNGSCGEERQLAAANPITRASMPRMILAANTPAPRVVTPARASVTTSAQSVENVVNAPQIPAAQKVWRGSLDSTRGAQLPPTSSPRRSDPRTLTASVERADPYFAHAPLGSPGLQSSMARKMAPRSSAPVAPPPTITIQIDQSFTADLDRTRARRAGPRGYMRRDRPGPSQPDESLRWIRRIVPLTGDCPSRAPRTS